MNILKDVDREILKFVDDDELLRVCSVSKRFYYCVCDDNFLRRRLQKYFDVKKYKLEDETWKKFFARIQYYVTRMKNYNFTYVNGDFVKQYSLLRNYKNSDLLLQSCSKNEISLLKYCVEHLNLDVNVKSNWAVRIASSSGYIDILLYLISKGADIHANSGYCIRWACEYGHYEIVKILLEHGADIHSESDLPLLWASENGHLDVVKLLLQKGASKIPEAIKLAIKKGQSEVVQYLLHF